VSQSWTDENYSQQETYDNQYRDQNYYEQGGYPEEQKPRRATGMATILLILGVVACSCLSCLIGTGLGLVVWEEISYTPAAESAQDVAQARSAWQTADVVDAFTAAGLECVDPRTISVNDGKAPFVAVEATRFMMPSVCDGCSGRIYGFDDLTELEKARQYYQELGDTDAQFLSWLFTRDNILVQLNGRLPEDQSNLYKRALMNMR
jgi:hypothetical protein